MWRIWGWKEFIDLTLFEEYSRTHSTMREMVVDHKCCCWNHCQTESCSKTNSSISCVIHFSKTQVRKERVAGKRTSVSIQGRYSRRHVQVMVISLTHIPAGRENQKLGWSQWACCCSHDWQPEHEHEQKMSWIQIMNIRKQQNTNKNMILEYSFWHHLRYTTLHMDSPEWFKLREWGKI